jgi:hypothetical protein
MALQQTTFRNGDTATGVASSGVNALKKWVIRSRLARVSPAARTRESKALQPFQTSAEQSGSTTAYAI